MPDIIQLLPEGIANQIAAGEVVQRPASVVKELLENAIDAGADEIHLTILEAGSNFIQIKDNGKGMSSNDVRICWERHATSKISKPDDLFNIHTFGFRGEALASIASVSHVEMKSRREDDPLGTEIRIEAGKVLSQEPVNCHKGTLISVKNLFYNVPARRNFLKSPSIELKHIVEEFNRVALPNPGISFTYTHNQNLLIKLDKTDLKTRIQEVLGKKQKGELLAIDEETDIVKISGYIGSPEYSKRVRGEQYFFINGRYVKEPYFNHAIQTAFQKLIPDDHFPFYVLFLEIDPWRIDVNVHPTKTEIKFEDSKPIYSILLSVMKKALGNYTLAPQIDDNKIFDFKSQNSDSFYSGLRTPPVDKKYNPFSNDIKKEPRQEWGKLFEPFRTPDLTEINLEVPEIETKQKTESELFQDPIKPIIEGIFQIPGGFIVCSINHELCIINKRSAHERVYYDQFIKQFETHKIPVQTLLFPRVVEFNSLDFTLVYSLLDEIKQIGFDISLFGKNTFVINGVPSISEKSDPQNILEGLMDTYRQNENELKLNKKENLARSMARQSALRVPEKMETYEIETLISNLIESCSPNFLPNGKPILIKLTREALNNLFTKS